MPPVSVIIPIYNSSNYIENCLKYLFNQTLKNIEFIFIDDGSIDDSLLKIEKSIDRYNIKNSQVKIIKLEKNRGVAFAREIGMKNATGEYITHCDSDDYIELDMYDEMFLKAKQEDADIICCDYYYDYGEWKSLKKMKSQSSPGLCFKNWFKYCQYGSLCNKLIKRKLIEEYSIYPFKDINWGEDIGVVMRCFYHANSILFINKPFYHYCQNKNSISHSDKKNLIHNSFINLALELEKYFSFDKSVKSIISNLKFNIKITDRFLYDNKKEWFHLFKECHKDILKFKGDSLKSRIIWRLALSNWLMYKYMSSLIKVLR